MDTQYDVERNKFVQLGVALGIFTKSWICFINHLSWNWIKLLTLQLLF